MTIVSEAESVYRWCALELAPENEFVGFVGDGMIGRIFLEPRPRFNGLWHSSSATGSDPGPEVLRQGFAASAQLAIEAVQPHTKLQFESVRILNRMTGLMSALLIMAISSQRHNVAP